MAFCPSCGANVPEDSEYCVSCGKKLSLFSGGDPEWGKPMSVSCPSCGADIPGLLTKCPYCGREVTNVKTSPALRDFIAVIHDADLEIGSKTGRKKRGWPGWNVPRRLGFVFLNILFLCIPVALYLLLAQLSVYRDSAFNSAERFKARTIRDYAFPTDRKTLSEVLIYIKGKIAFLRGEPFSPKTAYWSRIWATKAEEVYETARGLFPDDAIIAETYKALREDARKIRFSHLLRLTLSALTIAALLILFFYFELT